MEKGAETRRSGSKTKSDLSAAGKGQACRAQPAIGYNGHSDDNLGQFSYFSTHRFTELQVGRHSNTWDIKVRAFLYSKHFIF